MSYVTEGDPIAKLLLPTQIIYAITEKYLTESQWHFALPENWTQDHMRKKNNAKNERWIINCVLINDFTCVSPFVQTFLTGQETKWVGRLVVNFIVYTLSDNNKTVGKVKVQAAVVHKRCVICWVLYNRAIFYRKPYLNHILVRSITGISLPNITVNSVTNKP